MRLECFSLLFTYVRMKWLSLSTCAVNSDPNEKLDPMSLLTYMSSGEVGMVKSVVHVREIEKL